MIHVDYRVGSVEFLAWLPPQCAVKAQLPAADFRWEGHDGTRVGVERKVVSDLLSSWKAGRLVEHQLPLLQEHYDTIYLLVEGALVPCAKTGELLGVRGAPVQYTDLVNFLHTLETAGVTLAHTMNTLDSTFWLVATHNWWLKAEHKSLDAVRRVKARRHVKAPTLKRKWARELPGVGDKRAMEIDRRFASARQMADADVETWVGMGFGKGSAAKWVAAMREGE